MRYCEALLAIGQTVHDYLYDSPVMYPSSYFSSFSLLYYLCCTGVLACFVAGDETAISQLVMTVCHRIRTNCSGTAYLLRGLVPIDGYVRAMLECFWLNISDNKTSLREKILYYLLLNRL